MLKCALRLLKTELSSDASQRPPQVRDDAREVTVSPLSGAESSLQSSRSFHQHLRTVPVPVFNSNTASINDSPLFLYSKVFTFQFSKLDDNDTLLAETLSAVIIYNIALTLNLKGIRTSSSTLLKKALDLYKMSMGLLQHDSQLLATSTVARSMAIACCNNIGHLAFLLLDYEQLQTMQCTLQKLLTTSFCSERIGQGHQESSLIVEPCTLFLFDAADWRGFTSNVLFMQAPAIAPAA
jgi:hypothetical protein